ncbi:MAG TPA: hypothetical protein VGD80_40420 [Kofleriaceae bacterium]
MKKNIAQETGALRKLALRRETIQQLTIAQLGDVEGGAPVERSDGAAASCIVICTGGYSVLCSILLPC